MADNQQGSARARVLSQDDAVDEAAARGIYSGQARPEPLGPMSPALAAAYRDLGKPGGQQLFGDADR